MILKYVVQKHQKLINKKCICTLERLGLRIGRVMVKLDYISFRTITRWRKKNRNPSLELINLRLFPLHILELIPIFVWFTHYIDDRKVHRKAYHLQSGDAERRLNFYQWICLQTVVSTCEDTLTTTEHQRILF